MLKILIIIFTLFQLTAFTQSPLHSLLGADAVASSCDVDAQNFITAAGITDSTQKAAICQLVVDLKAASIWTKFYAIYPFVGGTLSTHKFNLKDPRDLDAAYRLVFNLSDSSQHTATGWLPALNNYANTFFTNSTNGTASSLHLSYYSRTNQTAGDFREIGAGSFAGASYDELLLKYTGSVALMQTDGNAGFANGSSTDSRGFFVGSRISTTSVSIYKNGSVLNTNTTTVVSAPTTVPMSLGAINDGAPGGGGSFQTSKECAFASIGQGLTSTEVANFYTAVQTFETTLGRQQ